MSVLKQVENGNGFFQKTVTLQGVNILNGNNLKFTKADRTDTTIRPYGNLFVSFNLPVTEQQKEDFTGGTYSQTSFSGFNQDKIIIVEIPKNEYGELIDGKTISLTVPIVSGGTNILINCYSTFFKTNVSVNNADKLYSDPLDSSSYFGVNGTTDSGERFSNVAYLFSDNISGPKRTSGLTWSNPTKFNIGKEFATYSNPDTTLVDIPIGIAYLDKGFLVLTHPTIVNNFAYSAATSSGYDSIASGTTYSGTSNFTNIYFSATTSATTSFNSIVTEYIQSVYAFAMPNEFFQSQNPTFTEAYPDGNENNDPVYITEIGLYNEKLELIAIAKTSEPIPKNKNNAVTFTIQLKL